VDDDASRVTPMFPLGSVLLPSMVLPLHVFEDRYRRMLDDVMRSVTTDFGVVLIERGSEVGGGEVRLDVGCTARVLEVGRVLDGRLAVVCVGEQRIRVTEWLDDSPYPIARTRVWPDPEIAAADLPTVHATSARVEAAVRRVAALGSELGGPGLTEPLELSDDPSIRSHQLGVLSPLGPLDRYSVLCAPGVPERLDLLSELLADQELLLRGRLTLGPD